MFCPALSSVIFQVGSPLLRVGQERAQIDLFSVGPEVLKRIELARLIIEHVDNDAAIVEQHPRAAAVALAVQRLFARLRELLFHFVAQGV